MADGNEGYYSRSWKLLSRDKGWYKPLLVMSVALFVPIVGALGVFGYELEWARLTAWGVDSSPKQKNVQVGKCIKAGWRGFVSVIGWVVIFALIGAMLRDVTNENSFVSILIDVAGILFAIVTKICALRAAIYQNFTAGYRADRIVDMLKRDGSGFFRIAGLSVVIQLITGLILFVLALILLAPVVFSIISIIAYSGTTEAVAYAITRAFTDIAPWAVLLLFATNFLSTFTDMILITAVGLWMRQFDVPAWGASGDPLPQTPELPSSSECRPVDPVAQESPSSEGEASESPVTPQPHESEGENGVAQEPPTQPAGSEDSSHPTGEDPLA